MMTTNQVEKTLRAELSALSLEALSLALLGTGECVNGLTRAELIEALVAQELYAFTH